MNRANRACVEVTLDWESHDARHRERRQLSKMDLWRDILPGGLEAKFRALEVGETCRERFAPGELVPAFEARKEREIPARAFHRTWAGQAIEPRLGRFYPQGVIWEAINGYSQDYTPFRITGVDGERLRVDINHPLARYELTLGIKLIEHLAAIEEHGGACTDLGEYATGQGPGMQAGLPDHPTDFYADNPFARPAEEPDLLFYKLPRMVDHIDGTALGFVQGLLARFAGPGMRVLDLMSSWRSHLPEGLDLRVTGLGLNEAEMRENPRLAEARVHDLNADPLLPFAEGSFDLVVCALSVEYLIRPVEVFREVERVLAPGGCFVCILSERWFPPKAIRLWTQLHAFERMGLVLDYYRRAGGFTDLHTESIRGWLKGEREGMGSPYADPVYAVWGGKDGRGA